MTMEALMTDGPTRTAFLVFFAIHIPITLLLDSQALLPTRWYPQALRDVASNYAEDFQDPNMLEPLEPWFVSFIACEVLIQLPFYVAAVIAIKTRSNAKWFPLASLVYASHTLTTMVPIMTTIILNPGSTLAQKIQTIAVYVPWIFFPAWLMYVAFSSLCNDNTVTFSGPSLTRAKIS